MLRLTIHMYEHGKAKDKSHQLRMLKAMAGPCSLTFHIIYIITLNITVFSHIYTVMGGKSKCMPIMNIQNSTAIPMVTEKSSEKMKHWYSFFRCDPYPLLKVN